MYNINLASIPTTFSSDRSIENQTYLCNCAAEFISLNVDLVVVVVIVIIILIIHRITLHNKHTRLHLNYEGFTSPTVYTAVSSKC